MSFDSTLQVIKDKVFWEEIPERAIAHIIPQTKPEHIAALVATLNRYTPAIMRDDAGDMADERYRMTTTVNMILDGLSYPVEPLLLQSLPSAIPHTQKWILRLIATRNYLPAYAAILALLSATKSKSVRQKCHETLTALGF